MGVGVFCKKKVDLSPQNETKLNQTLLDLFFILHFTDLWGCVRTQRTPLPAYGHA